MRPTRICLFSTLALLTLSTAALAQDFTGVWNGTYFYPPNARSPAKFVKFWMIVIDDNGKISGLIKEPNTFGRVDAPWLHSTFRGELDGDARGLTFTKTYDGTAGEDHDVKYRGHLSGDGTQFAGEWQIAGDWGGRFTLDKVANTGSGPLSGRWTGSYNYPETAPQPPVKFTLLLVRKGAGVAGYMRETKTFGEGDDPWLHADVKGRYDPAAATLNLTKTYDGTSQVDHDVFYEGRVSQQNSAVKGRWEIPGVWSSSFTMKKE